jgi:hypothetical protein
MGIQQEETFTKFGYIMRVYSLTRKYTQKCAYEQNEKVSKCIAYGHCCVWEVRLLTFISHEISLRIFECDAADSRQSRPLHCIYLALHKVGSLFSDNNGEYCA